MSEAKAGKGKPHGHCVYFPHDMYPTLREDARINGRSFSAHVIYLLRDSYPEPNSNQNKNS